MIVGAFELNGQWLSYDTTTLIVQQQWDISLFFTTLSAWLHVMPVGANKGLPICESLKH